ncbi:MAG: hypothetical protein QHI48_02475, partial [Bacteroidota bacterium]|nr:hypothetical protein [Bacteroidota bacterium]
EERTTRTDVLIGIVTGAEFLFSRRFTIGGEVQFNSFSVGKESIEPPPASPSEETRDYLNINTAITLRWFFF